ncbi:hypothetical protein BURPS1710b_2803 [Burkholderia pseudomallei 1710b]|uniref:Uncharacterized protein n=1 Tax=Burkholderia pseudomallei (strain 1710b) TaxID=320372 RepID=Q3JQG6_BURP1|nr:hypothetical protein BURPS1710b_2803 [Burkholderia pseudomallei 1710b]
MMAPNATGGGGRRAVRRARPAGDAPRRLRALRGLADGALVGLRRRGPAQQAKREPAEIQHAEREHDVARHAQPYERVHDRRVHDLRRARIPEALRHARVRFIDARGQDRQEHHHEEADVQQPERGLEQRIAPCIALGHAAQAEQHQADAEHPVHAEQRGVAVRGRHVQALHVVERDRRVDREAEQARADGVPQADRDEAENRPLVRLDPRRGARLAVRLPAFEAHERERHHFTGGEHGAHRDDRRRRAGEVQVVQRAENAAEQEHDGFHHDRAVRAFEADEAEAREDEGDHRGREHFEEAFDPQVHEPPSPVLDHRVVGVLPPRERRRVEEPDARGGQEHHADQAAAFGGLVLQRGHQRAAHQEQPEQQADEEQDLPDAAHARVSEPLIADPEREVRAEMLERAEPAGDGRADDDEDQRPEQHVHAEFLQLRLAAGQQRRDIEARREPGGRDPEHSELRMDRAAHDPRHHVRERNAEEAVAFHRIVRGDRAHEDLREQQADHDVEVLLRRAHRRRRLHVEERVVRRHGERRIVLAVRGVIPDHRGDRAEQDDHARDRPHAVRGGRRVAHERLVRPVVRVRRARFAGTIGRRRPRGPEEERRERGAVGRARHGARRHRVLVAQRVERRVGAEQRFVVRGDSQRRRRARIRQREAIVRGVVAVRAHFTLQARIEHALLIDGQLLVRRAELLARPRVAQLERFAVQPVRRPVRRDVAAVPPDGAELLAARCEPHLLAALDLLASENDAPIFADDRIRYRRRGEIDISAEP